MANKEQVERLLAGVEGWNTWRKENPATVIDLKSADLGGADLEGAFLLLANLDYTNLYKAILKDANLYEASLLGANLNGANMLRASFRASDLKNAHLSGSSLRNAQLQRASLRSAVLKEVDLEGANLEQADLSGADLEGADLSNVNFARAILTETRLKGAFLGSTILGRVDLSDTRGLEFVQHMSPSTVGTDTLRKSRGKLPASFLRGCGLNDMEIEYAKIYQEELFEKEVKEILNKVHNLRMNRLIQTTPLFISYSHADGAFVDIMEKFLDNSGIRYWRDIHDATSGRLEKVVKHAMKENSIVLLVLSKNSVKSDWVEHEVREARELEKELGRDVLCPVALDDAWKECKWPARLREQIMEYSILDFSKWKDEGEFAKMFRKLVDGLDLFYKEE